MFDFKGLLYRQEVDKLVSWCEESSLCLNVDKTKESQKTHMGAETVPRPPSGNALRQRHRTPTTHVGVRSNHIVPVRAGNSN